MSTEFLSKVDRTDFTHTGHQFTPGPGTYTDNRGIAAQIPGFAPFTTTAKRASILAEQGNKDTPAPGSYELQQNIVSQSIAAAGSSFDSKVDRFKDFDPERSTLGPGPGLIWHDTQMIMIID